MLISKFLLLTFHSGLFVFSVSDYSFIDFHGAIIKYMTILVVQMGVSTIIGKEKH